MAKTNHEILERNFILKRIGDDLYLPCEYAISCKVPPLFPTEIYVMCRTYRFNESLGRLYLAYPTGHERWSENFYIESTHINSELILSSNVKEFELIRPIIETSPPPRYFKPRYGEDSDEWKPTPAPVKANPQNWKFVPPDRPAPARTYINETRKIPIADLTFENGKVSFSQHINSLLGLVPFEITH